MMRGVERLVAGDAEGGSQGLGRCWRRNRVAAAVNAMRGMVAASSNDLLSGMWRVVWMGTMAYSAYVPCGAPSWWRAATRSPRRKRREVVGPISWTVPAQSSPEFREVDWAAGWAKSLVLEAAVEMRIRSSLGPGVGMGTQWMVVWGVGWGWKISSCIVGKVIFGGCCW